LRIKKPIGIWESFPGKGGADGSSVPPPENNAKTHKGSGIRRLTGRCSSRIGRGRLLKEKEPKEEPAVQDILIVGHSRSIKIAPKRVFPNHKTPPTPPPPTTTNPPKTTPQQTRHPKTPPHHHPKTTRAPPPPQPNTRTPQTKRGVWGTGKKEELPRSF